MRFLAAYILRGRMPAVTAVSVLAVCSMLFPPVSLLSSAGVALITLRKGWYEGSIIVLISGVAMALLGGLLLGNFPYALGYGLVLWVPVWLIAIVLRETGRLVLAIETVFLLGMMGIFAFYVFVSDPAGMWQSQMEHWIGPLIEHARPDIDSASLNERISLISHYMTGIMVAGSVSSVLLALLLGRWWQAITFNPGGYGKEFLALKPHAWIAFASVLLILIAALGGDRVSEMMWNMCLLVFLLFLLIGVAVLHTVISRSKAKPVFLTLMYLMMFFIPYVLLLIAVIGLTDTWFDWRARVSMG